MNIPGVVQADIQRMLDKAQAQGALALVVTCDTGEVFVYDAASRRLITDDEYPAYKQKHLSDSNEEKSPMSDQQSALQITAIDSALAALRDGQQTVQEIGSYIGGMWQDAENRGDQTAVQYFEAAWGLANVLAESNDHARAIVAQVGAERDQVVLQRDEVAAAYSDYQTAVIEMDLDHPEAGRHLKLVYSAARIEGFADGNESGFEDGLEAAVEGYDAEYELVSNITGALEIDEDDASLFASIILGNYGRMLPVTFYQKVGEAIKTLVAEAIALKPSIQAD